MECIAITNKKNFMSRLLMKSDFDRYLLKEAQIVTFATYTIDGTVQKNFYSGEEYEDMGHPEFSTWQKLRPICYEMIKGSKTPVRFKIVLKLNEQETQKMIEESQLSYTLSDVGGLYLNLVYENGDLNCITGTSMNLFTMDKSLEQAWDLAVKQILE